MRRPWPVRDEGGFVMVMVVLLLFAVAVAGATGYQLVSLEADLATGAEESQTALAAARAGLERFVGEHIGVPPDTATYVIADADVYVMPRRVLRYNAPGTPDLYLLEAVAELEDPRHPDSPARRTVRQYARLQKQPVKVKGVVMNTSTNLSVGAGFVVQGNDQSPNNGRGSELDATGHCTGNATVNVAGTAAQTTNGTAGAGATLAGSPAELGFGSVTAVIDSAGLRWDVLQDLAFPIPNSGSYPGSFPADSFPVVRIGGTGSLAVNVGHADGQGVLIVPGQFSIGLLANFDWNGIILAGSSPNNLTSGFLAGTANINGALITGLDGGSQTTLTINNASIRHYSCYIARANRSLAYFELLDGTRWEF